MNHNVASSPAIALDHVRIDRGGQPIIPDLSLAIPTGSVFGLVGPSGSGKTTIMRALLGLTPIIAGRGELLGIRAGDAALRPRIGYMPQGAAVYQDLSARQNLEFFGGIYRVPRRRVQEVLDLVDLAPIADRPVASYSGGQLQRVGLGVALLHQPPILILDEPTVGLDPRLRHQLWAQFADWARAGTTLLISTHVMDEAAKCDQVALLLEGRLVASDSPAALLRQTGTDDLEAAVLRLAESPDAEEVLHVA